MIVDKPNIETQIDADQSLLQSNYILCPKCKQKLADLQRLTGVAQLRFKCRRFGAYSVSTISN